MEKKQFVRKGLIYLAILSVFIFVASCSLNNKETDPVPVTPVAFVSLYQASPDAPEFNILVDNQRINNGPFGYSDYTGYLRFRTGERKLSFSPYGANNVVVDTTVVFEQDKAYSLFVVDAYQKADIVILSDNSDQPAAGKAKIRVVNLSPDVQQVDFVTGSGTVLFDNQAFKAGSEFKEVDANVTDFVVKDNSGNTLLNLPSTSLQSGGFYTIVVRGYSAPPSGNNNVLSAEVLYN